MELRGDIVKDMRLANNWTQQHLADVCGVNMRTIQRVENKGTASLETLMALCVAFDTKRETFFEVPSLEQTSQIPVLGKKSLVLVVTFISGVALGGAAVLLFMR
ncbi:helix-turn-helix domain-containing protein [Glaciecola sp. XM2]|jgi:transcriptional regulator with XRE-family HTH domain|uniref:helix-turn-helix transcriptional regulator n=1 Tax=Glaciecola sp. XM2 TaxID=1914931 RepID=UPI001BDE3781|nr:helix-turn-helix transcriptional regulator [Glaciecola sp. XM2]MBT1449290.1 helix-turn-helix domain-containing protein [Glaciecola sp. XM2]